MNEVVIVHPKLTTDEARALTEEIRGGFALPQKILQAYNGHIWKALGYESFREWGTKEYGKEVSRIYQLLNYARVDEAISTNGGKADLNERQARELLGLDPEQAREVIAIADQAATAAGKKRRTTEHVIDAVATVTGKPRAHASPAPPPHAPGTISDAELDAGDIGDPVARCKLAFRECDDRQKFKALGQQIDDMPSPVKVRVAALILSTLSVAEVAELARQVDFAALLETSRMKP